MLKMVLKQYRCWQKHHSGAKIRSSLQNRGRIPSRSVMVLSLNSFSYCIVKGVRIQLPLLVILSLVNVCISQCLLVLNKISRVLFLVIVFKVFQWLETLMLGLLPVLLSSLLSLTVISILVRILLICCRTILVNVCDNTDE